MTPQQEAARLELASGVRPAIIPLHPIVRDDEGKARCGCRNPTCKVKPGKHPMMRWAAWPEREQRFGDHGHAVATGKRSLVFVVEADTNEAEAYLAAQGMPDTFTTRSGSGRGLHRYFKWPGFDVLNSVSELAPGVDVRGDGGVAVLAGSPHASGGRYEVVRDVPIADAPAWLLAHPKLQKLKRHTSDATNVDIAPFAPTEYRYTIEQRIRAAQEEWFATARPSISGQDADKAACHAIMHGALNYGLTTRAALLEAIEPWNERCVDASGSPWPWSTDDGLDRIISKTLNKPREEWEEGNFGHWKDAGSPPWNAFGAPPANDDASPKNDDEFDDAEIVQMFARTIRDSAKTTKRRRLVPEYDRCDDTATQYLVDGLLPVGEVGMFVAQPYALKTYAAYSLAVAVAQGNPWLGKYPTRRGKVLVLDYEMGRKKAKARLRILEDGGEAEVGYLFGEEPLSTPELWAELYRHRPDLVIVDSLSAGNRLTEENDPKFAAPLDCAKKLSELKGGTSFIFIHHPVKDTTGRAKQATVRGSGAIFGALDFCYALDKSDDNVSRVKCIKMRNAEEPEPFAIELNAQLRVVLHVEKESEKVDTKGPLNAVKLRVAMGEKLKAVQTEEGELRAGCKIEDLAVAVGKRKEEVSPLLAEMQRLGEVMKIKRLWHLDGPDLREERVKYVIRQAEKGRSWSAICSETKLARVAHVDADYVRELQLKGRLERSSEGESGAWIFRGDAE